jgi:flagellar motility protein MotE (MotC chaperone)
MIRWLRNFRVVPVVVAAVTILLALKTVGLVLDGSYTLGDLTRLGSDDADITGSTETPIRREDAPRGWPARGQRSWAQQMFGYPDVTGSVASANPPAEAAGNAKPKPQEPPPSPNGTPVQFERPLSAGERAVLERLQERRNEIEARARELDMRENLLKAAEKRLESRVNELKDLEARVNNALKTKDEGDQARFKNLITMYENMKAKEAAKIFDRLDMRVLLEVATQLNPRRMSDILALMTADAAERLTIELATRAKDRALTPADLPKIEGRSATN